MKLWEEVGVTAQPRAWTQEEGEEEEAREAELMQGPRGSTTFPEKWQVARLPKVKEAPGGGES